MILDEGWALKWDEVGWRLAALLPEAVTRDVKDVLSPVSACPLVGWLRHPGDIPASLWRLESAGLSRIGPRLVVACALSCGHQAAA